MTVVENLMICDTFRPIHCIHAEWNGHFGRLGSYKEGTAFFLCNLLCDWLIFELRCWITNKNLWIFNKTYLELRPYCTRYALVIQPVTCYGSSREELGSRWSVNFLLLLPNGFFFIAAKFLDGFWWKIALEHRISSETSPMVPSTNV